MKNKNKKKSANKNRKTLTIWMLCLFLIGSVLISFALTYDIIYIGQNENKIKTCSFDVSFKDSNPIQINNAIPMSDFDAKAIEPYTFYIRSENNTCTDMTYTISMYNLCDNCEQTNNMCTVNESYSCDCNSGHQVDPDLVKYELKNLRTGDISTGTNPFNMRVTNTLTGNVTDNYELRLWISSEATNEDLYLYSGGEILENVDGTYQTKNICMKLGLNNQDVNLDQSGANVPVLATGMIPVYYDEMNEVWRKADITNNNENYKWYDYNAKIWANAVTYNHNRSNVEENKSITEDTEGTYFGNMYESFTSSVVTVPNYGIDYISMGHENYNFGSSITVAARIKLTYIADGEFIVGNAETAGFYLCVLATGKIRFGISNSVGTYYTVDSVDSYDGSEWINIAATYGGATMKLFINGQLDNTTSVSISTIKVSPQPICIGVNPNAGADQDYYHGRIAKVFVSSAAFTEAAVAQYFSDDIRYSKDASALFYANLTKHGEIFNASTESTGAVFNGTSSYIDIGRVEKDFGSNITVAARINFESESTNQVIVGNPELSGFYLIVKPNNKFAFGVYSNSNYIVAESSLAYVPNTWYNIVGVYDGATVKLYVNGTLVSSVSNTGTIKTSNKPIYIGANPNLGATTEYFHGIISDVVISESALIETEVSQYYGLNFNADKVEDIDYNLRGYDEMQLGTVIPMKDINTMLVWIPRFRAVTPTTPGLGNEEEINITFLPGTTGTAHDAFTFGSAIQGFWVGKYELGGTIGEACTTETCTTAALTVLPGVAALDGKTVSNFFFAIRSMERSGNAYGFNNTIDTTLDPHMMKNNEWGAVVYLTQSKYGRCTNGECSEVERNNNDSLTGYGAINRATTGYGATSTSTNEYGGTTYNRFYNTSIGQTASTTGNIYGIYDMSGGRYEYVMGNYTNTTGSSGFASTWFSSNAKYVNIYTTESAYTTSNLQHAMVETAGWYSDGYVYFDLMLSNLPWIMRGGGYSSGISAGVMSYVDNYGLEWGGTRLTITK